MRIAWQYGAHTYPSWGYLDCRPHCRQIPFDHDERLSPRVLLHLWQHTACWVSGDDYPARLELLKSLYDEPPDHPLVEQFVAILIAEAMLG